MDAIKKLSDELPFLKDIEALKKKLDNLKPLSEEVEKKVLQKLRLDWNYNSNAIEGNAFTFGETIALLMEGITAKGKPLKDALDIKGHNDAIDFMMEMIYDERDLNEADIRNLHKLILGSNYYKDAITSDDKPTKKLIKAGQYKTESNHVKTSTGEIHYYATPKETPAKMEELINWYNNILKSKDFNPLVLASLFHHKFVAIHPFDDGNGRMTRILTNFVLLKFGYPVSVIRQENKGAYYACLAQADSGELIPIIEYISDTVKHSLNIYFKAINGEDINEPDDLDKEIALFRKEIGVKSVIKKRKKDISVTKICFEIFSPLKKKLDKFSDIFNGNSTIINGNRQSISFNIDGIGFLNYENFLKVVTDKLSTSNVISFEHNYIRDIYLNNLSIKINLSISFKPENYIVTYKGKRMIKYYEEIVFDIEINDLIKEVMQNVMTDLRKIKK